MTKTMTYVDALNIALASVSDEEAIAKLTALKEQIVKRNSADRKPTAKQKAQAEANEALGERVLAVLSASPSLMTVSEIVSALGDEGLSTQKVSAIIKSLGAKVERHVDKRKALYKVAE